MASVLAACIVSSLRPDAGTVGVTAIDKRPVEGEIKVGTYGLYADVQADRKHHGGIDQAVYVYGQDDAEFWAAELGRQIPPGWFGENLRVEGVDPQDVRVGERWRVGTVELEATYAREPCQTFARWVASSTDAADERGWVKRFWAAGRFGAYFRVLTPGRLAAGDAIEVLHRPSDGTAIRDTLASPVRLSGV
ncbi:MOSC domain-containing protein [Galbitalea sp. SE-J8]|uniref:MOSC domain-containing protein n=1 Tax=Galbitalea sp. SE-J8 TaxID=3054952 RepID=UPI00259CAFE9|nr:MOSC domain-containing protein [Galbitalea sp. SE-J8]MDM4764296.1 MOSC domain-containing protein [Galbitalea sp. SE-J8]